LEKFKTFENLTGIVAISIFDDAE